MKKRRIGLVSLTLGGMLAILPVAHSSEEQTVAAPKKSSESAAKASPKKEDPKKVADKKPTPARDLKECDTKTDVNTLEDLFRATAVASILEPADDPAPGSSTAAPVVWRKVDEPSR